MFDGLILPEYLPQGGSNDIGSGDALTSFNQLPGGGFFDNYGSRVSPQNIRPITRNCLIWGDTADEMYEKFNAIRGKIGKRGKLSVMFDNGQIWWQWARLQRVHNPRPLEAKGNWLPCTLTFVTASQQWYGVIELGAGWEVGDETFHLGDGTAELGMEGHAFDLDFPSPISTLTTTLTTGGSTFVRNMRIEMQADENLSYVQVWFGATGHLVTWVNPGILGGWTLLLDTGEKSCRVRRDNEGKSLVQLNNYGSQLLAVTTDPHLLTTGDSIELAGTEYSDGVYHNIVVGSTTQFTMAKLPELLAPRQEIGVGTVYPLEDAWSSLTVHDRTNWLLLAPGDNPIDVNLFGNGGTTQVQDYSINFSWYTHYK